MTVTSYSRAKVANGAQTCIVGSLHSCAGVEVYAITKLIDRYARTHVGLRAAKRAEAQAASRDVYRRATKRFATELRAAGMVLESDEGWAR